MLKGQRRSNGVCQVREFPSIKTFQSLPGNSWEGHILARCHCRVCYVHSSEQTVRLGYSLGGKMQWMRILCRIGWWIHFLWVMLTMQLKLQTVVAPHLGELRSQLFSVPPGPPSPVQRESRWGTILPSTCQLLLSGKPFILSEKIVGEDHRTIVLGNTECIGLLRGEWWF